VITWKGDGNDNLNVAQVATAGDAITGIVNKAVLGDRSPASPSLGVARRPVVLTWRGDGNTFLNVMTSDDGGRTFGNKLTSTERSPDGPVLAVHNGAVMIAWRGDGNTQLKRRAGQPRRWHAPAAAAVDR